MCLLLNDSEARQLTNEYSLVKAAKKILKMGPKYLVIKREHGTLLFWKPGVLLPALPSDVFDPTGYRWYSFAGGFCSYLDKSRDISFRKHEAGYYLWFS